MGKIIISHKGEGKIEIYKKSKKEEPFSITKSIWRNDCISQIIENKTAVIFKVAMKTCLKI